MTDVNFPQDFYLDDVGVWRLKKEKLEELEKPKPLTNEEYLRSLNTEQLAKWIAEEKLCRGYFIFPSMEEAIQDAMEWLKEIHT